MKKKSIGHKTIQEIRIPFDEPFRGCWEYIKSTTHQHQDHQQNICTDNFLVVNTLLNKFWCSCGNHGDYKSYYDVRKFYCEECRTRLGTPYKCLRTQEVFIDDSWTSLAVRSRSSTGYIIKYLVGRDDYQKPMVEFREGDVLYLRYNTIQLDMSGEIPYIVIKTKEVGNTIDKIKIPQPIKSNSACYANNRKFFGYSKEEGRYIKKEFYREDGHISSGDFKDLIIDRVMQHYYGGDGDKILFMFNRVGMGHTIVGWIMDNIRYLNSSGLRILLENNMNNPSDIDKLVDPTKKNISGVLKVPDKLLNYLPKLYHVITSSRLTHNLINTNNRWDMTVNNDSREMDYSYFYQIDSRKINDDIWAWFSNGVFSKGDIPKIYYSSPEEVLVALQKITRFSVATDGGRNLTTNEITNTIRSFIGLAYGGEFRDKFVKEGIIGKDDKGLAFTAEDFGKYFELIYNYGYNVTSLNNYILTMFVNSLGYKVVNDDTATPRTNKNGSERLCMTSKFIKGEEYLDDVRYNPFIVNSYTRNAQDDKMRMSCISYLCDYNRMNKYILQLVGSKAKYDKYPKDLVKAHNKTTERYNQIATVDEVKDKAVRGVYEEIKYLDGLRIDDKHVLIVPKDAKSIVAEGTNQHHCVASYIDKVIKRETMILFVRDKDSLDKSLYTLQISPISFRIMQFKGAYNHLVPKKISDVVQRKVVEVMR